MTSRQRKPINERLKGSRRARQGKLDIIKKRCNKCGHYKALITTNGLIKCSRCKRQMTCS